MKYRIVEQVYTRHTDYLVQKKVFGFWVNEVRIATEMSFCDLTFRTIEEAREWIIRQKPVKDFLLVSRVVE